MTKDDLLTYLRAACDRMLATVEKKNADYTAAAADALANFKAVELLGICSAETGIMVRRCDKFMREVTFVKGGILKVKDETVEDTLFDDAAYALLMAALLHERRNTTTTQPKPKGLGMCPVCGDLTGASHDA